MRKLLFLLFFLSFYFKTSAQTNSLYPTPQIVKTLSDDVRVDNPTIKTITKGDKLFKRYSKNLTPQEGAYYLITENDKVTIVANDQKGIFYGLQTFNQLYVNNQLPQVEIIDYPDVRYRGVVEGFYGTPWSHEDRLDLLAFYGKYKMNTYIYGPKDDPYHSSPYWRNAYPENEAKQIIELVETANKNMVDFVWAIHPGKDIKWNNADRDSLMNKFEMMYDLGVRSYAVFFDDISGEGTNPIKQSELLNYIYDNFMRKKKDSGQLIICPTEYNKSWSNPKPGTYLDILGDTLYPEIEIMWTGDRVISDMTEESMEWINKRLKRKAYIWWNFPVSDYVRDHLLLGQVYGNSLNIKNEMAGFMTNPMERAQASKIAIYSVADYSWNVANYDSLNSWKSAIKEVMPSCSDAFETFASHNSDLGLNGHRYRRKESELIKPIADSFLTSYNENIIQTGSVDSLYKEYKSMQEAGKTVLNATDNPSLIKEIKPWLLQFSLIGVSGQIALNMINQLNDLDFENYLTSFLQLKETEKEINYINDNYNRNPYQPGVKSASLVMKPLIDSLVAISADRFYNLMSNEKITSRNTRLTPQPSPILNTQVYQLKNQPILVEGNTVRISPLLEVIRIQPNAAFEIIFPYPVQLSQINTDFGNQEVYSWMVCDVYDENNKKTTLQSNNGEFNVEGTVKRVRFSSKADKRNEFYLRKVDLVTKLSIGSKDDLTRLFDKDIATSYQLEAGQEVGFNLANKKEMAILTDSNPNITVNEYNDKKQIVKSVTINGSNKVNVLKCSPSTTRVAIINNDAIELSISEIIFK